MKPFSCIVVVVGMTRAVLRIKKDPEVRFPRLYKCTRYPKP